MGTLATSVGGSLGGFQLGASIAIGAALMLASVMTYVWVGYRLIAKKSIAWTVMIIVIKYAVLLISVAALVQLKGFRPVGMVFGVGSFALAALLYSFFEAKTKNTTTVQK